METSGLAVVEAASKAKAIRLVKDRIPDGVVYVWPMKGIRGELDLLRFLRHYDERMVIVVVRLPVEAVREVLEAGADLCLLDPYDVDLVAAHMELGMHRRRAMSVSRIHLSDLTLDVPGHQVWRREIELGLTPIEFRLLVSLVVHEGEVVSKGVLFEECWRRHDDRRGDGDHLVEVHVSKLRKKLHACGEPILHTSRGVGYVLRPSRH